LHEKFAEVDLYSLVSKEVFKQQLFVLRFEVRDCYLLEVKEFHVFRLDAHALDILQLCESFALPDLILELANVLVKEKQHRVAALEDVALLGDKGVQLAVLWLRVEQTDVCLFFLLDLLLHRLDGLLLPH